MPDVSEKRSTEPADKIDSRLFRALDKEINKHSDDRQSESLLGSAVSAVTHEFWHKDQDALADLKFLQQEAARKKAAGDAAGLNAMQGQIEQAIKTSRDARETEQDISHYGSGFIKTAAL